MMGTGGLYSPTDLYNFLCVCGLEFHGSKSLIIKPSYEATRREGQVRFGSKD